MAVDTNLTMGIVFVSGRSNGGALMHQEQCRELGLAERCDKVD